ncbi:MAG: GNAT family N-acetyltransferase [Anaerolineae bacterium]|nr:GNAT family N-acetyltransferase [Anaerolineae bacterium]
MLPIFTLTTPRLTIRPFVVEDLDAYHPIANAGFGEEPLAERREWIEWVTRNYAGLARLYQPPYGDRAITLTATGELIGSVGIVPSMGPFDKLPYFRERQPDAPADLFRPEVGLFWVISPAHQRQGYAAEAATAVVNYLFTEWHLNRIIATTEYDNEASISVMRRIGMRIERNPDPTPEWFQVVGILEHPSLRTDNR